MKKADPLVTGAALKLVFPTTQTEDTHPSRHGSDRTWTDTTSEGVLLTKET